MAGRYEELAIVGNKEPKPENFHTKPWKPANYMLKEMLTFSLFVSNTNQLKDLVYNHPENRDYCWIASIVVNCASFVLQMATGFVRVYYYDLDPVYPPDENEEDDKFTCSCEAVYQFFKGLAKDDWLTGIILLVNVVSFGLGFCGNI